MGKQPERATPLDYGVSLMDNLSIRHFNAVHSEIQGRFFSQKEADLLKKAIDRATVTDPQIRAEAAKCWGKEDG